MINRTNLILLFIAVFLIDGLVMPSIFGFKESVVVLVFLFAMLLNWGAIAPVLWLGSVFSLFLEFFWKIQLGSLVLLFVAAALLYFFISSVFSIKRYAGAVILSVGFWLFFGYNNFAVAAGAFAAFAVCFVLFDQVVEVRNIHAKF